MAKPLTPAMCNRLLMAYDHAGDLLRDGFHPLMIIRSLQSLHTAFYGYASCTTKLRCAGVEVTSSWKNHAGMLEAWIAKAAARLEDGQASIKMKPGNEACPSCDNTGFKDHAGFAMDLCECRMPPCRNEFDYTERCIKDEEARTQQEAAA